MQKLIDFLTQLAGILRSILGISDKISAQSFPEKINEVYEKGLADGVTDLTELINTQEYYIYGENNDLLHKVGYSSWMGTRYATGSIECKSGDVVYLKGITIKDDVNIWAVRFFNADGLLGTLTKSEVELRLGGVIEDGQLIQFTVDESWLGGIPTSFVLYFDGIEDEPIVTINEPIK